MTGILIVMTAVVLLALCMLGRWQRSRKKEYPGLYDGIYPVGIGHCHYYFDNFEGVSL